MKKLLALVLCFVLLFSFTACKGGRKNSNDEIDLEYYAKVGQIPEMKYKLGFDCEKANTELQNEFDEYLSGGGHDNADHEHDHYSEDIYFERKEENGYIILDQGNKGYYCKTSEKDKKIDALYTYDNAFGIETGSLPFDVKNKMASIQFKETEITEGSLFYADYMTEGTVLTAEFNDVTVQFAFQESGLVCTAIFKISAFN